MHTKSWHSYFKTLDPILSDLISCLKIPSISTDPSYKSDTLNCAKIVQTHMTDAGLENIHSIDSPCNGYPILYGDWLHAPDKPTLLIYAHYDVQPADPAELWTTPAFEPTIRDGYLYARGMSDNKGQLYAFIHSIKAHIDTNGRLPINIKIIVEGEEESGSPSLGPFLDSYGDLLKADAAVIADTAMLEDGTPSICFSLRGLAFAEITVTGPSSDLHSGQHGGPVPNPITGLTHIMTQLKGPDHTIKIPGFYDPIAPVPDDIIQSIRSLPFSHSQYTQDIGAKDLITTPPSSVYEQQWFHPTLDFNGIIGGYTGEGCKTIIPSTASTKVTMRLVEGQDPDTIAQSLKEYVHTIAPLELKVDVTTYHGYMPARCNTNTPQFTAAINAVNDTVGSPGILHGDGGSVPIIHEFKTRLGLDTVMFGFYLRTDNIHAPNERMSLKNFQNSLICLANFYDQLSKADRQATV